MASGPQQGDDRATSHVGSIGHQSASGGKSADHPDYASPDRPKVVDVDLQVDLDSWNVEEELVTGRQDGRNRFINKISASWHPMSRNLSAALVKSPHDTRHGVRHNKIASKANCKQYLNQNEQANLIKAQRLVKSEVTQIHIDS